MRTADWLKEATTELVYADIVTARLDCLVLLEDESGKDRAWLLSHPEHELQGSVLEKLNTKIAQRAQHIPLAYIRRHAEFYGREFKVNEYTLVPRPETEAMIELLKSIVIPAAELESGKKEWTPDQVRDDKNIGPGSCVLDVGTGSGCLAITAALELPELFVQACDIDANCLKIAEQNATALNANVHFYESDLLSTVAACDILLCNLPYVPENFEINTAATHEPKLAIFGGQDGLDYYRELFAQIRSNIWKPAYILCESLPESHKALASRATENGYDLLKTDDFIQVFKLA